MPFDGSQLVLAPRSLLQAALSEARLVPIDAAFLEEHKVRQLREHPPGWIYRHSHILLPAQALVLLAGIVSYGLLCSINQAIWGLTIGLVTFGLAVASLSIPMRGPARWRERPDDELLTVHPDIRSAAERLKDILPDTEFIIGELFQDRIRLDPYLLAEYRGAQVVLGIWDEDKLIACA